MNNIEFAYLQIVSSVRKSITKNIAMLNAPIPKRKECMIKENRAELLIHTYSFTASAAVMLSHISVLFQGTTQLHNFASHDIHPTSTKHSSYLSLPFWRWIPRSYGFRTTRFSQNISSIKLGLQENSQKHIFDKPVPVSNGSFLS